MRPGLCAFAAAAGFLGAAVYIGLVEQPARLALGARAMMREWMPSNRRGTLMLSVLAAVSAILAYIQFRTNGDIRWIIGGAIILDPGKLALYLFFDDAGEHLAFRHCAGKGHLARAQTDAGLGLAGVGARLDRTGRCWRIRVGAGLAAVIDGHQGRWSARRPHSPPGPQ
jgi:hypothetical protein